MKTAGGGEIKIRSQKRYQVYLISMGILLTYLGCRKADESFSPQPPDYKNSIAGMVEDESGPVQDAVVRIQASPIHSVTDALGQFQLNTAASTDSVTITAWAPGYYIGGGFAVMPGDTAVVITLHAHHQTDNPNYNWVGAHSHFGDPSNCQNCHASSGSDNTSLPFDDWILDAHSLSAENHRFLTMYLGTDIYGNQSPPTRYGYSRDYGTFPLLPIYDETYFGPGYKLDFPETAGNCAACHVPANAVDNAYGEDPTQVSGVAAEGIGCDFC